MVPSPRSGLSGTKQGEDHAWVLGVCLSESHRRPHELPAPGPVGPQVMAAGSRAALLSPRYPLSRGLVLLALQATTFSPWLGGASLQDVAARCCDLLSV